MNKLWTLFEKLCTPICVFNEHVMNSIRKMLTSVVSIYEHVVNIITYSSSVCVYARYKQYCKDVYPMVCVYEQVMNNLWKCLPQWCVFNYQIENSIAKMFTPVVCV